MSLFSALSGVVVGFILKSAYDFFIYSRDRHDNYFFVLLTKRFEVYQEANSICEQLKSVIHESDTIKTTQEARKWFHKNNLYLSPALRDDFKSLIMDVEFYGNQLNDYHLTSLHKGNEHQKTKEKQADLKIVWNRTMCEVQEKLQRDLDKYFKALE